MADIPGDTSTTSVLAVGSTITGTLETLGDHDWYRITLSAGQSISVSLNGITFADTYLYIRDSAGTLIYSNDDISSANQNSQVAFTATSSGTYYIDAGAWNEAATGTYQVSVATYTPPPVATNDQIAAQLVSGYWGGDSHHFAVTQGGTITVNISTLNAGEQALARAALAEWTDIIGVNFREVTTGAQISFDNTEQTAGTPIAATSANWSKGIETSARVQISSSWVDRYGTSLYSYSLQTYVHEIGHALGLGHAGNYNNSARYPFDALFQNDSWSTSIMSYFDQRENTYFAGQGFTAEYAVTPMVADILAMQQLYGLSTTTRTTNTTYGFNSNVGGVYDASLYPRAAYTIFDSGGNDTLDFSGGGANQTINLNPETFSSVDGQVGNLSIARGVVIENAIGGSGVDTIVGNSSNNVLRGGAGADTLTGGGGSDTFLDTMAGHNGDRIVDFNASDAIVFSDATLGSFTFSLTANNLSYTGGSLTFGAGLTGTLVATAASGGGVQLSLGTSTTPNPSGTHNDVNGDGFSDILWRNDNGTLTVWLGQSTGGFNIVPGSYNLATSWHVAGTGDFNADGRADLLLRNDNGFLAEWDGQTNGGFVGNPNVNYSVSTDWHVAGTGDFNGDGRSDILWRNDNGFMAEWNAQSTGGFVGNANVNYPLGNDWHVSATGDFNGDGRVDLLLRNDSGLLAEWNSQQNGGFVGNANVNYPLGNDWHVSGTGDFNGDGIDDLLLRNDSGLLAEWSGQANGGFVGNANVNYSVGTDWHVAGTGDFNRDGINDILWRNDNGAVKDWLGQANGGFVDNSAASNFNVPVSWHVQDAFL